MALPERLYYPLDLAAKKAGCEIRDLIHFAAIGQLEICTRLKTDDSVSLNYLAFPPSWIFNKESNVHKYGPRQEDVFMFFLHSREGLGYIRFCRHPNEIITAVSFDAFFSIGHSVFQEIEFENNPSQAEIGRSFIALPRGCKFYAKIDQEDDEIEMDEMLGANGDGSLPHFVMRIKNPISISNFIITAKELELFENGGQQVNYPVEHSETPIQRTAVQDSRILQLLKQQKHDPKKLPKRVPGKPWVKSEIWGFAKSEKQVFQSKNVFDKSWERLRNQGEIQESDS